MRSEVDVLEDLLGDPDRIVRAAVDSVRAAETVRDIAAAMTFESDRVVYNALTALGAIAERHGAAAHAVFERVALDALGAPSAFVRRAAVDALSTATMSDALYEALVERLRDPSKLVRTSAYSRASLVAVGRDDDYALQTVLRALSKPGDGPDDGGCGAIINVLQDWSAEMRDDQRDLVWTTVAAMGPRLEDPTYLLPAVELLGWMLAGPSLAERLEPILGDQDAERVAFGICIAGEAATHAHLPEVRLAARGLVDRMRGFDVERISETNAQLAAWTAEFLARTW